MTMRQLWITGRDAAELRTVAAPVPRPGEVLVTMAFAGICGSDLHTVRRGHPWLPYPLTPGHEGAGVVEGVGSAAAQGIWHPGDRVYLRPAIACGDCFYCHRSLPNLCANLIGVGSHIPGFFADLVSVPPTALAAVPDGIPLSAAAMIEPLATAVHAVARSGLGTGGTVVVIGGGSIGQCVLIAALAAGAAAVVVIEPQAAKRVLAVESGAAAALDPTEPEVPERISEILGGRPDVVLDCVAAAATVRDAVRLASRGGTVVVVGVGHGPVELPIESIQDDEVAVVGSAMYLPADFDRAEALIAAGAPVARLVTAVRPLAEAVDALAQAATGVEVKIQLSGPAADLEVA